MKKWKLSYQVEEAHNYVRETKEQIIEAETREEADLWASRKIILPMAENGPYIPFIYGSAKIEEVK